MAAVTLYFHSPCFDGIVSAVLARDFLETRMGWRAPALRAVNYDQRATWLATTLDEPAAVVDFLYHPAAAFWADHHLTAFLDDTMRSRFVATTELTLIYDASAASCAGLLWRELDRRFGYRNGRYAELIAWADKIDAARYDSVDEAVLGEAPALRLALGFAAGEGAAYSERLVGELRVHSLAEVASLPEAQARHAKVRSLVELGLDRFKRAARLEEDGIAVFDVDSTDAVVPRYAPYYFYPQARYSAGVVRWPGGAKVTAMRNPWREFTPVPLGRIAAGLGGGGHERIGSVALRDDDVNRAPAVLSSFLAEIRRGERAESGTTLL